MAKPDYNLCVAQEDKQGFSQIGAAWTNDKGQIQIKLNTCVTLTDRSDIKIYLFEADQARSEKRWAPDPVQPKEDYSKPPFDEDDVPF